MNWFSAQSSTGGNTFSDSVDAFPFPGAPTNIAKRRDIEWKNFEWKYGKSHLVERRNVESIDNKKGPYGTNRGKVNSRFDTEQHVEEQLNENQLDELEDHESGGNGDAVQGCNETIDDRGRTLWTPRQKNQQEPLVAVQSEDSRRIHILGLGPAGKFVALALAALSDPPPVSLLFSRGDLMQAWIEEGQLMEVIRRGSSEVQAGFDIELMAPSVQSISHQKEPWIEMLIITTRASLTVPLLLKIRDRLRPSSTICFLQNQMGIVDEVNARVFPNEATRPRYVCGYMSHLLVSSKRAFTAEHRTFGETYLSLVPMTIMDRDFPNKQSTTRENLVHRMNYGWNSSSRKLMRTLTRSVHLNASGLQYNHLLRGQLERLAVSAVIEPLSVVFDCRCGDLLSNFAVTVLMRSLLGEISKVLLSLPELVESHVPKEHFSPAKLERSVIRLATVSKLHVSSMLQDIRKGVRPEIDYLNGYIVKRGKELGIECPVNSAVIQMVKGKQAMISRNLSGYIPFDDA